MNRRDKSREQETKFSSAYRLAYPSTNLRLLTKIYPAQHCCLLLRWYRLQSCSINGGRHLNGGHHLQYGAHDLQRLTSSVFQRDRLL